MDEGPGCRRCCSCPHGNLVVLPGILSVISWLLSVGAITSCFFFWVEIDRKNLSGSIVRSVDGGFGFTNYGAWNADYNDDYWNNDYWREDGWCKSYRDGQKDVLFDSAWKAGYAMAILASIFGGIAMILTLATCCAAFSKSMMSMTACLYVLATIFQGLVLVALSSDICTKFKELENLFTGVDINCNFGWGAGNAVASTVLWLICGCVTKIIPGYVSNNPVTVVGQSTTTTQSTQPVPYTASAGVAGSTTITETIQPDGTKVTEKTTTMPDGSQVVETTTEKPM